ncbi:MAG: hypothetical protein AAFR17_12980 [Pseudomonadota bacterium]
MNGAQILVFFEMVLVFGGLIAFGIWQQKLMRKALEEDKQKAE